MDPSSSLDSLPSWLLALVGMRRYGGPEHLLGRRLVVGREDASVPAWVSSDPAGDAFALSISAGRVLGAGTDKARSYMHEHAQRPQPPSGSIIRDTRPPAVATSPAATNVTQSSVAPTDPLGATLARAVHRRASLAIPTLQRAFSPLQEMQISDFIRTLMAERPDNLDRIRTLMAERPDNLDRIKILMEERAANMAPFKQMQGHVEILMEEHRHARWQETLAQAEIDTAAAAAAAAAPAPSPTPRTSSAAPAPSTATRTRAEGSWFPRS